MVRFDVKEVERLCEMLLCEKGYRLKLSYGETENFLILGTQETIEMLGMGIARIEKNLEAAKTALLISELAYKLGANVVEEE